jgi:hypothetical protein
VLAGKLVDDRCPFHVHAGVPGRVSEGRAYAGKPRQVNENVGALDERIHRGAIGDARLDHVYLLKSGAKVCLVASLFSAGIGCIRKVVDDGDVVPSREQGTRQMVADEADASGYDHPRHLAVVPRFG